MKDSKTPTKSAPPSETEAQPVPVPEKQQPASPKAPVTTLPSSEPLVPAERAFVASKADPIVASFLHTERLRPDGVRKLSRTEWLRELEAFKAAPRG
jgi:hypothetical protein